MIKIKEIRAFPLPPAPNGQAKLLLIATSEDGELYKYDIGTNKLFKVEVNETEEKGGEDPEKRPLIHKV